VVFSHLLANDSVVGIDIGSSQIKVVYAEPCRKGSAITHVAMCPTPRDSVKEGVVIDIVEVGAAIRTCLRSSGIKSTNVIAAIAGPGVIVRQVQVPAMTERVLRKSIQFEAGKYISANVEDSIVEFDITGPGHAEGQMSVMLAAAPKMMVESRVAALEHAGLCPIAVDVEVFANLRAMIDYNPDKDAVPGTIALLDIGASHSEINLISKSGLEISRTIPIAGESLTNSIKNARGTELEEAEAYKHELDLTELCDMPAGSTSDPSLRAAQLLIDELLREIRRSVNYYQSQLPDGAADNSVEALMVTGGTSRMKGLAQYIHSRLGMDVRIGNPHLCKYVAGASGNKLSDEDMPLISVAFGLAVKEMQALPARSLTAA